MALEQDVTLADDYAGVFYARRGRYRVMNSMMNQNEWLVSHARTGHIVSHHNTDAAAIADAELRWESDQKRGWQRNQ